MVGWLLQIKEAGGREAPAVIDLRLAVRKGEKTDGALAEPAIAADAQLLEPDAAIDVEAGQAVAQAVERLEAGQTGAIEAFQQIAVATKMDKVLEFANVDAGESATGNVQTGDISARLGVPRRPARPEYQPRRRVQRDELLALHPVIPVEHAHGIVRRLDGDAAGRADSHELGGFIASKKQVRGAVRAGGHIPGRESHTRCF